MHERERSEETGVALTRKSPKERKHFTLLEQVCAKWCQGTGTRELTSEQTGTDGLSKRLNPSPHVPPAGNLITKKL